MTRIVPLIFILIYSLLTNGQNHSIDFDGTNDRILVNNSTGLNPGAASAITLEAWIYADAWRANAWQGTIVSKDQTGALGYVLRCGNNGSLSFTVGNGNGNWTEVLSAPIMQINKWHHVAAVMDNGMLRLYIDGNQVSTLASVPMLNSTRPVYIGESAGFFGRVFDGKIDEVRVWNTVRSASDIASNMMVDLPSTTPNLMAYFKIDSLSGNTVFNEIGTTSNGTLQNFTGVVSLTGGYVVTSTDLTTSSIQAPDLITAFSNYSKIKVAFTNTGNDTISTFSVGYLLNAGVPVTETVNQTLFPGDAYVHTFSQLLSKRDSAFSLQAFASTSGDLNALNDSVTVLYPMPNSNGSIEIPIFTNKQHNFGAAGQNHFKGVVLPDDNLNYGTITLEISVACPSSGCDPWDQPAKISISKNGQLHEIARYITPYGKGCGPWVVDVTDFKTLLRGYTEFASYIQVWGASGWLLNAKLIYDRTPAANPYQKLTPLWASDNWVYGDPAVSYDLPARAITVDSNTNNVGMRMTITGHGQGNTNNAAEFSQFTHQVAVNGSNINSHILWNSNCNTNTCSNQFGTWQFARAGWCPGEAVDPYHVNMTSNVSASNNLTVDYVLQPYTNNLRTGYNGSNHTQPHYKVHSYLVEKSDQYIDSIAFNDLAATAITSPTSSNFAVASPIKVMLKNYGSSLMSNPQATLSINGNQVAVETISSSILPGDSLEYTFTTPFTFNINLVYTMVISINTANDEASSNDVVLAIVDRAVGLTEESLGYDLNLFPNPTNGGFTMEGKNLVGNANVSIYSISGQLVVQMSETVSGKILIQEHLKSGVYFIELELNGERTRKRVIVL
ncbi:MAG: archaellum component FlaF (FlaF/FlaG flagellin family) [Vicingaceae bacterium]|jgi:archaellum component FlaF (FlaF/FlaG flagellin family)